MSRLKFLAALFSLLAFASLLFASIEYYSWADGTSAPIECVQKCRENGINVEEKREGNIAYLSNACKSVCYGKAAILEDAEVEERLAVGTGTTSAYGSQKASAAKNTQAIQATANTNTQVTGVAVANAQIANKVQPKDATNSGGQGTPAGTAASAGGAGSNANEGISKGQNAESAANAKVLATEQANAANGSQVGQENEAGAAIKNENALLAQERAEEKNREHIEEKLREQDRLDYSQIAQNETTRIVITPSSIRAGYEEYNITNKRITVIVGRKTADIVQGTDSVIIEENAENKVFARQADIINGKIIVEGQEINILPSDVIAKTGGQMQSLELSDSEKGLQYAARVKVNAKIFGIISAPYEKEVRINAQNGEIISEEGKPWWGFIAFE